MIADEIRDDFVNDGKYMTEDYSKEIGWNRKRPLKEVDRLEGASDEARVLLLSEVMSLENNLRKCYDRLCLLDKYIDGDINADRYLKSLNSDGISL